MSHHIDFDALLAPTLIPTIMLTECKKMLSGEDVDLIYAAATLGIFLSSVTTALHHYIRTMSSWKRSRNVLTLMTATLTTMGTVAAIILFHFLRLQVDTTGNYRLPASIQGITLDSPNDVFTKHLHADIIPGLILATQQILCLLVRFELMNRAKRTFTFGESFIIAQLVSLVYLIWSLNSYGKLTGAGPFILGQTTEILLSIAMTLFATVFLPCYVFLEHRNTAIRYLMLIIGIGGCFQLTRNIIETERIGDPFTWLVQYIFASHQRLSLFSLWLSTLAGCVGFSTSWSRLAGTTNSLVRKVFHVAVCVIFVTGYNLDLEFTRFAAGGMIIVMLLLEMIRAWNLHPVGPHLEKVCQSLRGRWDNRYLTLSHIYLLVGTMIPLWLLPQTADASKQALSSGLISLGIGDTAAAVFGTFYGRTPVGIKNSGKTLEGLAGNIVAMILFKLFWVGYVGFLGEFSFAFVAALTAYVELVTTNCDNLVLPLAMLLTMEIFDAETVK